MTKDTELKTLTITQTEHQRVTIKIHEDGVYITQTFIEGYRMPSETVWLTKQELAKIAKKCKEAWPTKVEKTKSATKKQST